MKTLVMRTGALGDSILTLAAVRSIIEFHPDSEYCLLGNSSMLEAAKICGIFEDLVSIETGGFHTLYTESGPSRFVQDFLRGFDKVYAFTSAPHSEFSNRLQKSGMAECRVLDPNPPSRYASHVVKHLFSITGKQLSHTPILPEAPVKCGSTRFDIAIHPGSGGNWKNWPTENFREIASNFANPLVILGPAEENKGMEEFLRDFRVEKPSCLRYLCDLLSVSELYLGNDSGVSHCAAWCGIPSVVLYGKTDPDVWRPLGEKVWTMRAPDRDLKSIGTEDVFRLLKEVTCV